MREAPKGDVRPQHIAYLTDRVLVHEGKAQVYGTQAEGQGSDVKLMPITDEANVDKRRALVGLGPLAEYLKLLKGQNDRLAGGQAAAQGDRRASRAVHSAGRY